MSILEIAWFLVKLLLALGLLGGGLIFFWSLPRILRRMRRELHEAARRYQ